MKKKNKKTEQKKDLVLINVLKITGVFVSIMGFYIYFSVILKTGFASVASLSKQNFELISAITSVARKMYIYLTIFMGITLMFELINYVCYLFKAKWILILSIVVEIITFVVSGLITDFNNLTFYIILIPVVTGLINYFILLLDNTNYKG